MSQTCETFRDHERLFSLYYVTYEMRWLRICSDGKATMLEGYVQYAWAKSNIVRFSFTKMNVLVTELLYVLHLEIGDRHDNSLR